MKPGVITSEFAAVAGVVSAILGGAITSERQQILATVLAGGYAFLRTLLKAAQAWKATAPAPTPAPPPPPPGPQP